MRQPKKGSESLVRILTVFGLLFSLFTSINAQADTAESVRYDVGRGDTLQKISMKFFGTTRMWSAIYEQNRKVLASPEALLVGIHLEFVGNRSHPLLSSIAPVPVPAPAPAPAPIAVVHSDTLELPEFITVKKGDSLWALTLQYYGSPNKMKLLTKLNPHKVGPDHPLYAGTVLRLRAGTASVPLPTVQAPTVVLAQSLPKQTKQVHVREVEGAGAANTAAAVEVLPEPSHLPEPLDNDVEIDHPAQRVPASFSGPAVAKSPEMSSQHFDDFLVN